MSARLLVSEKVSSPYKRRRRSALFYVAVAIWSTTIPVINFLLSLYMPFKKTGTNRNVSPSGRVFTDKQVKLYYATDGFKNRPKKLSLIHI